MLPIVSKRLKNNVSSSLLCSCGYYNDVNQWNYNFNTEFPLKGQFSQNKIP